MEWSDGPMEPSLPKGKLYQYCWIGNRRIDTGHVLSVSAAKECFGILSADAHVRLPPTREPRIRGVASQGSGKQASVFILCIPNPVGSLLAVTSAVSDSCKSSIIGKEGRWRNSGGWGILTVTEESLLLSLFVFENDFPLTLWLITTFISWSLSCSQVCDCHGFKETDEELWQRTGHRANVTTLKT